MKKYSQLVLVTADNSESWLEMFTSDKPIDIKDVWAFFVERDGFNEDDDGIDFIDMPTSGTEIDLDTIEKTEDEDDNTPVQCVCGSRIFNEKGDCQKCGL